MTKPQQQGTAQRTAQQPPPRAVQQQPRAAQQPRTQQQRVAQSPARQQPRSGTDEFARLMRQNTVDVSGSSARRKRNPIVGKIAFGLAIVCVAVDASAFAVFMGGDQGFAFGICFVVVFLTFIAAVLGFIAAVGSLGRWYGVLGVVIAFFANPVVLIVITVYVAPEVLNTVSQQ